MHHCEHVSHISDVLARERSQKVAKLLLGLDTVEALLGERVLRNAIGGRLRVHMLHHFVPMQDETQCVGFPKKGTVLDVDPR